MSLNSYNSTTGELTNIASGSRTWIGTKAEWQALVSSGTAPKNCLVAIIDDVTEDIDHQITTSDWLDDTNYFLVDADYRRYLTKKGNTCHLHFLCACATPSTSWVNVLKIPEGANPAHSFVGTAANPYNSDTNVVNLQYNIINPAQGSDYYLQLRWGETPPSGSSYISYFVDITYVTEK